jgi:type II secretory pathway component PulF
MATQTAQKYEGTAVAEPPQVANRRNAGESPRRYASSASEDHADASLMGKLRGFRVEFGPSRKDILHFTSQLAVMVRAGISLQDALEAIGSQCDNVKFKAVLRDLKMRIEEGNSFSQALAEHPQVFNNLYINMVAAAEASGSLSDMLQKLAEYLDQEAETRSQIKGAMVYPVIIAVMAVSVTVFLMCCRALHDDLSWQRDLLPMPTVILMASSAFLRHWWYVIVPAIGAALWGFYFFINTTPGRAWWDQMKLILPLIRTLCRSLYITRGLHTMGVLTKAGVPILNTISITAHISGNVLYKEMWLGVYEEVRRAEDRGLWPGPA